MRLLSNTVLNLNKLMNELDKEKYLPMFLNFSAQTSPGMTQQIVDGKLSKLRKGFFGPPIGKTYVVFVDDLLVFGGHGGAVLE